MGKRQDKAKARIMYHTQVIPNKVCLHFPSKNRKRNFLLDRSSDVQCGCWFLVSPCWCPEVGSQQSAAATCWLAAWDKDFSVNKERGARGVVRWCVRWCRKTEPSINELQGKGLTPVRRDERGERVQGLAQSHLKKWRLIHIHYLEEILKAVRDDSELSLILCFGQLNIMDLHWSHTHSWLLKQTRRQTNSTKYLLCQVGLT